MPTASHPQLRYTLCGLNWTFDNYDETHKTIRGGTGRVHRPLARHSGASSYTPRPQVLSPRQRQLAQRQAGACTTCTCRQRQRASGAACSEAISFLELLGEHAASAVAVEEARQHVAPRRRAHLSAASDRKRGARPAAGERTRRSTRTYVPPPTAGMLSRHMNESTFPSE